MTQPRHRRIQRASALLGAGLAMTLVVGACGNSSSGGGQITEKKVSSVAKLVPKSIASKGTLTVATDPSYAPNEFVNPKNQQIEGMDVDLGNALAQVMGVKVKFVSAGFDSIIPGLAAGRYDFSMSSFTDTKERQGTVDFVTYFSAGTSFYTSAKGGATVNGLSSLCGLKVGVEKGTTQQSDAQAQSKKCTTAGKPAVTLSIYPNQSEANVALSSGRVQVVMADSPVADYAVKQSGGQFKLVGPTYGTAPYGIAVPRPNGTPPGQAPLDKALLAAMKQVISDGTYMNILKKWGVQSGAINNPVINGATS